MPSKEPPACPFCGYFNMDHYFLLQHVETVHPEGVDPSPFTVADDLNLESMDLSQERERTREGSPEYIECQCGEFCLLAEFESHLDMHYAEGTGFDENPTPSPDLVSTNFQHTHGKVTSRSMENPAAVSLHTFVPPPCNLQTKTRTKRRSHSANSSQDSAYSLFDAIRYPSRSLSKKPSGKDLRKGPHRLGVSP